MSEASTEEEGEIELSLGLSLCGSFKKSKAQEQRSNSSETPLFLNRVRERETREEEAEIGERSRKRERVEGEKDPTLTLRRNASPSPEYNLPPPPIQVVPQQYSCVRLHYPNAVPYSCVMPCWAPVSGDARSEACAILPAACRSFQPYQGGYYPATRPNSENVGNQTVLPNGRSSPAFSDNGSTSQSQQGGSSSDTGSFSNHCKQEQSAPCETREDLRHPEHSVSSSNHMIDSKPPNSKEKVTLPGIIQSNPATLDEQTKPDIQTQPVKKPVMPELQKDSAEKPLTPQGPVSVPLRLASQDMGKPPKPEIRRPENQTPNVPSLSQMPCVSTTGNGPNGSTITGFLYRYTKSEVSIVCVCHGSSFSPAEFVEHAGGTAVKNPLKHITVVPSAFG